MVLECSEVFRLALPLCPIPAPSKRFRAASGRESALIFVARDSQGETMICSTFLFVGVARFVARTSVSFSQLGFF